MTGDIARERMQAALDAGDLYNAEVECCQAMSAYIQACLTYGDDPGPETHAAAMAARERVEKAAAALDELRQPKQLEIPF